MRKQSLRTAGLEHFASFNNYAYIAQRRSILRECSFVAERETDTIAGFLGPLRGREEEKEGKVTGIRDGEEKGPGDRGMGGKRRREGKRPKRGKVAPFFRETPLPPGYFLRKKTQLHKYKSAAVFSLPFLPLPFPFPSLPEAENRPLWGHHTLKVSPVSWRDRNVHTASGSIGRTETSDKQHN